MTTLICWVAVDSRGPAAAYIASDSRISWNAGTGWNHGQKVFTARTTPDMFGFCGDVVFATSVLSQAVSMIDSGLLYDRHADRDFRLDSIEQLFAVGLDAYPNDLRRPFSVLYCYRTTENTTPAGLNIGQVDWSPRSGWTRQWLEVPSASKLVVALGSGGDAAKEWDERWARSDVGGTSRAVFSGFCDHLASGEDPRTGGAPQVAGFYRKGPAFTLGFVGEGGLTYLGLPVSRTDLARAVGWRDCLFQLCDPLTGRPAVGAQLHARPVQLL